MCHSMCRTRRNQWLIGRVGQQRLLLQPTHLLLRVLLLPQDVSRLHAEPQLQHQKRHLQHAPLSLDVSLKAQPRFQWPGPGTSRKMNQGLGMMPRSGWISRSSSNRAGMPLDPKKTCRLINLEAHHIHVCCYCCSVWMIQKAHLRCHNLQLGCQCHAKCQWQQLDQLHFKDARCNVGRRQRTRLASASYDCDIAIIRVGHWRRQRSF